MPRNFSNSNPGIDPEFQSVVVLSPRGSPSLDYYLHNIRDRAPRAVLQVIDSGRRTGARAGESLAIGRENWLVVVRYAHKSWVKWLARQRDNLTRVTWFLDDDVAGAKAERTLPRLYAWRTFLRYSRIRRLLLELTTDMAFSTPELARRYPEKPGEIWTARQVANPGCGSPVTYFYHCTAAHREELRWLAPIVKAVQERVPEAWFEVMVDSTARQWFRGIPRVRCLYPMSWPDFLAHTAGFPREVGLAPLLDTPFNRARAPVKFFDITRTGAAGIYSDGPTYESTVKHGSNGLLLSNNPKDWEEAIVRLLRTPSERHSLAAQARHDCHEHQQ